VIDRCQDAIAPDRIYDVWLTRSGVVVQPGVRMLGGLCRL
jgi:hypothetical protein